MKRTARPGRGTAGLRYRIREQRVPVRARMAYRMRREGTLYLSDLDGTLLCSDQRTSRRTNGLINRMIAEGMRFTYATARSLSTARKVTAGMDAPMPVIVYNGAFIMNSTSGDILAGNLFSEADTQEILRCVLAADISPIVYAYHEGREQFRYNTKKAGAAALAYIATRSGDPRDTPADSDEALLMEKTFYFTCIDAQEKLEPLYEAMKDRCRCIYSRDIYTGDYWLEMMPKAASKAHAGGQLKALYGCERVISFGDSLNDLDMFAMSDRCYAVANAAQELKNCATAVIGCCDEDSVARWLYRRWRRII